MKLAFMHVCDYASLSREGKLSVMGIFQNISAPNVPVTHPMMYLAFGIEVNKAEFGRPIKMEIELVDNDGKKLIRAEAQIGFAGQAPPGRSAVIPQLMGLGGTQFARFGDYSFHIFLNDNHVGECPFSVTLIKPQQGLPT